MSKPTFTPAWAPPEPDRARVAAGWERRFLAGPERAQEVMELYRALGYEVCADPIQPEVLGPQCEACALAALMQLKTIYTRRRNP